MLGEGRTYVESLENFRKGNGGEQAFITCGGERKWR